MVLSKIDEFVKEKFDSYSQGAHAYDHSRRVFSIAKKIGESMGADMKILLSAALLHDIGRIRERETGVSHSIISGKMSTKFLDSIGFSKREIEMVKDAIRTHRFSEGLEPNTLEGKILSDADKLDAIGAIGVYRTIAHSVETGVGMKGFLRHADEKLLKLRNHMYTEAARQMAVRKHKILSIFIQEIRKELEY
ncbi:MAG: Ribonuclease Y [Candidatus Thorarchaeota archaeon]|nr:MAG: Ribonuclease Y [Candidatus Thorarchaeota archaeon]